MTLSSHSSSLTPTRKLCRFNMRTLMILDAGTEIDEVLGAAALRVYGPFQSVFNQQGMAA